MVPFPWGNVIMIGVGLALIYLGIEREYEPLLLVPIGFGSVLVNIPYSGVMEAGGFIKVIYEAGIATDLFPVLIFLGIGAMSDFGPLLEKPWVILLSIPAHLGIFVALFSALQLGFAPIEASSIGIIGAMDGPTAVFVTSKYTPHLLGPVTVAAYSYIAMVPILQIPLSRLLTSKTERKIRMEYRPEAQTRLQRVLLPILVVLTTGIVAPEGIPLMGSLMLGNFLREAGVVERLARASRNEIADVSTLLLGLAVGGTMGADQFLQVQTLMIFALGLLAFVSALALGIAAGKIMAFLSRGKVNPLIGATAISAFPMASRVAHKIAREEDPDNWLLMHAMAANTGGQIASVLAGSLILTYAPVLLGIPT